MVSTQSRIKNEIYKLYSKNFEVTLKKSDYTELEVIINGPPDTPFFGGKFKVNIHIPQDYPFKSPSIGFGTKIFHPNIDENSGSVCLDVLNQVWSPLFDLTNVVEIFLPQLLLYPNALDPLNTEAATIYMNDRIKYNTIAKMYVDKYARNTRPSISPKIEESSSLSIESDEVEI
ncbi:Ubiquitin-conjugating enzyme E2 8 [Astathelohania contejeani]|uniref:Ubiquitin-conjugating enzyme E2 8 n=1 Tax=Astathelohania contejeani TaxID=164912 RepID=A0ABQ7HXJ5_9MICR|nr:Ubiquitin-conjugating enzyme E2 8 [Thelohania contejeani]